MSGRDDALWRLSLVVPDEATADLAAAALQTQARAVSFFESGPGGAWRVEAYADDPPDRAALDAAAALAALALGATAAGLFAGLAVERLAARDWLAENRQSFPPIRITRFFIYGSHHEGRPPAGAIGLRLDAATAFGTGEHPTTHGCLLALDAIAKRRRIRRPLDMGTGTAILAMAAARGCGARVLACDIDAGAVAVARVNAGANGVARLVRVLRSDGYRDRRVREAAPFDLVFANILARPLAAMAGDLARHLAPGGIAILSGLLARQAPYVLAAHRAHGLRLIRRIRRDGWDTLVLGKSGGR